MSEHNKAAARRYFAVFSDGRLDAIEELFAADYHEHDPVNEVDTRGIEGAREEAAAYRAGSSDLRFGIEDQLADGDRVVTRWIARGTHDGDLLGIAATGNPIEVEGITIHRFTDGRIQEAWWNWDVLGLMRQLDALPSELPA